MSERAGPRVVLPREARADCEQRATTNVSDERAREEQVTS
ncbi:MAG: hypothetical protein JWN95_1958 [Frankiales bacterium]|nr:hypothetical protein [Frankiales bacterium]